MNSRHSLFSVEGITDSERFIHTPGDFVRKNLLYVQEVGKLKSLKPHCSERENLSSFLFIMVKEGSGVIEVMGKKTKVKAGDCALINCMHHYSHMSSENEPWSLAWVHFNGRGAEEYYELFTGMNSGSNFFTPDDSKVFDDIIEKLMNLQGDRDFLAELQSNLLLVTLVNEMVSKVFNLMDDNDARALSLNSVREYLNDNLSSEDPVEGAASLSGLDRASLNELFAGYYGISIEDYVTNRRINMAKEMLRFTIKPVDEVIKESGIKDVETFNELFLKSEGMSCSDYRKRWAQWIK
ncbi:MAG: AraC family transcriptional regulator [Lachnospiraceae bacterium]|nr:AraC family transcriptional regulator [Lachnospiraceae bacterium]